MMIHTIPKLLLTKDKFLLKNFSSLDALAVQIMRVYIYLTDQYHFLTKRNVYVIQQRIREGEYQLSHLKVYPIQEGNTYYKYKNLIPDYWVSEKDIGKRVITIENKEDRLVLDALGLYLHWFVAGELMDNSLGLQKEEYLHNIRAIENVNKIYRIDLSQAFMTINREGLLEDLSKLIKDKEIFKLIRQYLYLPIMTDPEKTESYNQFGIPPTGELLSAVLLNFVLIHFDKSFICAFPNLMFLRYFHEVLVFLDEDYEDVVKNFENEDLNIEDDIYAFLEIIHLRGRISSIGRGEGTMMCDFCSVSLKKEGKIEVKEREIE